MKTMQNVQPILTASLLVCAASCANAPAPAVMSFPQPPAVVMEFQEAGLSVSPETDWLQALEQALTDLRADLQRSLKEALVASPDSKPVQAGR